MKRYPKRARPLWGRAKPQAPIRYVYGPTTVKIHGTDDAGNAVEESVDLDPDAPIFVTLPGVWGSVDRIVATTVKMRADIKIKVSIGRAEDPSRPPEGTYLLTYDSGGGSAADFTIAAGHVVTPPPITVRP